MKGSFPDLYRPSPKDSEGSVLLVTILVTSLLMLTVLAFTASIRMGMRELNASLNQQAALKNARLGLTLAVARLQEELGDDRRVTAPANLLYPAAGRAQTVGVWNSSLSPFLNNPLAPAPDYDRDRREAFRGWLVSHPDPAELRQEEFVELPGEAGSEVLLFTEEQDGHTLGGRWVASPDTDGRFAWAVTDEGVKARINLGEDAGSRVGLDRILLPAGPHLGLSAALRQPQDGWALRKGKLNRLSELKLDPAFGFADPVRSPETLSPEFTTHSRTVLADVARGGLRIDLSMAFEMPDSEYGDPVWGSFDNPFRNGAAPRGEMPLFSPATSGDPPRIQVNYDGRGDELREFFTGAVPTFDHLRDHYRHSRALAGNGAIAVRPQNSPWWEPSEPTVGGVAPVLNRLVVFFSLWVDPTDVNRHLRIVLTPFIVLWNPYDVPIESPAYFVHQRVDFPVRFRFTVPRAGLPPYEWNEYLSGYLGRGVPGSPGSGRSVEPYFLMQLTRNGTNNTREPIRLEPGEVRLFGPASRSPIGYRRTGSESQRTLRMMPVDGADELNVQGGFALNLRDSVSNTPSRVWSHSLAPTDRIDIRGNFARDRFHYMVTLEDGGRRLGRDPKILSEVMVYRGEGVDATEQIIFPPPVLNASTLSAPRPVALIETFNRTALDPESLSNLLYTVNLRQRFANAMLTDADFTSGPHYQTDFRVVTDFLGAGLQITPDAQRSFYGARYAPPDGRDRLVFFEIPRRPMVSVGAFQHADLVDTAFAPANAFGNSWASPYLDRRRVADVMARTSTGQTIGNRLALYDHSYLLNHALWDRFFFSTLASGSDTSHVPRVDDMLARPEQGVPENRRLGFWPGEKTSERVRDRLTGPARALAAAAHLLLEGGFNINSTSEEAWLAVLSSARGLTFPVRDWDGTERDYSAAGTVFPRISHPRGTENDLWTGFRELSDAQLRELAGELVSEVRSRGPFRSLGEFVNRRVGNGPFSLEGTVQAAIDRAGINAGPVPALFDTGPYPFPENISPARTDVGLPGWLTQADVLQTLGPVMTARSDTFVIRAAGESPPGGAAGARVVLEAVAQRVPDWVEAQQVPETPMASLTPVNRRFGRRFILHSLRVLEP